MTKGEYNVDRDKEMSIYLEKLDKLTNDIDDNYLLGYYEAILNILGEFSDGQCTDCIFSYEVESYNPDFIYPEIDLKCRLDECWIDSIKKLLCKNNKRAKIIRGQK
jgi:hypothetical protein